ncbi:hypothetical protein ACHQM5_008813 [Ranunculus cassubicifolius]
MALCRQLFVLLLVIISLSSINLVIASRHLLDTPASPALPTFPTVPMPTLPPLPTISTLPNPTLVNPTLPTIPTTLPPMPSLQFPTTMPTIPQVTLPPFQFQPSQQQYPQFLLFQHQFPLSRSFPLPRQLLARKIY